MFICQSCGIVTAPREPQHLKVVETRKVVYDLGFNEETGLKKEMIGEEIVRELRVCKECAKPKELDFVVVH